MEYTEKKRKERSRERINPSLPLLCLPTLFLCFCFRLCSCQDSIHSFSLVRSGAVSYRAGPDRVLYTYSYSHTLNPTILQQTTDHPNARKQDPSRYTQKPQYPAGPESETYQRVKKRFRQCNRSILLPF